MLFDGFLGYIKLLGRLALRKAFQSAQDKHFPGSCGHRGYCMRDLSSFLQDSKFIFGRGFERRNVEILKVSIWGRDDDLWSTHMIQQDGVSDLEGVILGRPDQLKILDGADPGIHFLNDIIDIEVIQAVAGQPCTNFPFVWNDIPLNPRHSFFKLVGHSINRPNA